MLFPVLSRQSLPHEEEVRKWTEAAKCFFEEEQDPSQVSTPAPLTPKTGGIKTKFRTNHRFQNVTLSRDQSNLVKY